MSTEADMKTAREVVERYFPNPLPPGPQWRDAPVQMVEGIAAALAAQREELAEICDRLSQNALHNSTVLFHHGDEESSDECEALAGALSGAAAAIRKGETV